MATRSDREHIERLSGLSASSSSSNTTWKNQPTLITVPSNPQARSYRPSGVNPFNANPNPSQNLKARATASVGNVTSRRTMLRGNDHLGEERPGKRRKVEELLRLSSSSAPRLNGKHGAQHAEEIILVDDEGKDDQHLQGYGSRSRKRQSSDELNIVPEATSSTSWLDQFRHKGNDQRKTKHKPPLAPDPPDLLTFEKKYVHGDLESDHIESFSESDRASPLGMVKDAVRRFEVLGKANQIPKIDLTKKQKPKAKQKMKGKIQSSLLNGPGSIPGHAIASRTSSSAIPLQRGSQPLPVEAFYVDNDFHNSDKQETIFSWSSDTAFNIRYLDTSFIIPTAPTDGGSITFSKYDETRGIDPIVQFHFKDHFVTVKFDVGSPLWSPKAYEQFTSSLSRLESISITSVTVNTLWKIAQHFAADSVSDTSSKHPEVNVNSRRIAELKEIQERKISEGRSLVGTRKRKARPGDTPPGSPLIEIPKSDGKESEGRIHPALSERRHIDQVLDAPSLRRSTRSALTATPAQSAEQDEVILVYPQGTPGAVNITQADLRRLSPGEFLNDTLIEFGLKSWLKDLEKEDPELASQIHIFNSFFYKKLNQKDPQQAYESVKKWTSRFDIFQKKYIIVPINEHLHWYLAIIYEPEHVLVPALPDKPSTRKETRLSKKTSATDQGLPMTTSEQSDSKEQNPTPSEAEVERNLNDNFQNSCTIDNGGEDDELLLHSSAMNVDDTELSLSTVSEEDKNATPCRPSRTPDGLHHGGPIEEVIPDSAEESDHSKASNGLSTVPPSRFYGHRPKGAKTRLGIDMKHEDNGIAFGESFPQTYIFTMDSLGTRHPQAIKRLANYLKMEAQDKRGVQSASSAVGKSALVPVQPNFCDCGVYLLHFARTFMSQPEYYCQSILTQKPRSTTNKERQLAWHDDEVERMRKDLIDTIGRLSAEWKKVRAASVEARKTEQLRGDADINMIDSDTDVELVEPVGLTKQSKSARRK